MKTFSQRWKYYVGLGAALVVASVSFLVYSPAQQRAYAACIGSNAPANYNGCDTIFKGCPGAAGGPIPDNRNKDLNCAFNYKYDPSAPTWNCPVNTDKVCIMAYGGANTRIPGTGSGNSQKPGVPGSFGQNGQTSTAPTEACAGSNAPAGTNCGQIPMGCPGSTVQGPISPSATVTCPYLPTGSFTCRAATCNFPGGQSYTNGQVVPPASSGNTQTSADSSTGCDFNGNPLTWVICPIVGLLETGVRQVDGFIMNSLEFDTKSVFDANAGYKQAWSSFRLIASAILIIAGLIMISSQALGLEVLDVYTVKKTLPKILIAALFINLSWIGMRFVIEFFNTMGFNIRELIYSPFSNLGGTLGGSTLFIANVGVIAAIAFLGPMALLTFLGTALLAVLIGFIVIIVRNMALTVLIVLAPVAIASWVLPNTQKLWNLWKDNFLGLLLLFPIISSFIAVGRVMSAVSLNSGGSSTATFDGTVAQIIGFVMYFLPYFMLPIAFRLATGVIGSVAGFVNDRNRGAFDRLKKFRGNKIAENSAAMSAGNRFNNGALNALTSRTANIGSSPFTLGMSRKGRQAYQQKTTMAAMADAKGKGQAIMYNDDALRAATYSSAAAAEEGMRAKGYSETTIQDSIAAVKASGGFGRSRQVYAAQQMMETGTAYKDIEDVAETIARVSNGNEAQVAALAGNINSGTKRAGRHDLAPGASTLINLAKAEAAGQGAKVNPATQLKYQQAAIDAWNSGSLYQHANDKGANMDNAIKAFTPMLTSPDAEKRQQAAVFFNELDTVKQNASGDVKNKAQAALETNRAQINALYGIVPNPSKPNPYELPGSGIDVPERMRGAEFYQAPDKLGPEMRDSAGKVILNPAGKPMHHVIPGERVPTRFDSETAKERVSRLSRGYDRIDPNLRENM